MSEVDVLGPVDFVVVEFPADKASFSGEIAAELGAMVDRGRGVLGGPVRRGAAVVGTAAVVKHGHDRREDRRDDRRDRRGPGRFR